MGGAGQSRSSPNCVRVCLRGEPRAGVSDRTTARPRPLLWLGPSWAPDRLAGLAAPGLPGAAGRRARRAAGGARATGSSRPRPASGTRAVGLTRSLDPERPAPRGAAPLRAGLEREQPVAEKGGDLSAGDKQAINSGAKSHLPGRRQQVPRASPGPAAPPPPASRARSAHTHFPAHARLPRTRAPRRLAEKQTRTQALHAPRRTPRNEHLRAIVRPQGWSATRGARGICGEKRGGVGVGVQLLPRPP